MRKYIKPSIIAIAIETEEILRASKPNMSIQPEAENDVYMNYNRSVTTDLAGFGLWANSVKGNYSEITDGVKVLHRTDYNYSEVADGIKDTVSDFSNMTKEQVAQCRANADKLSKKALWSEFIKYYEEAYDIALRHAEERQQR